jgi:hypothetical protein
MSVFKHRSARIVAAAVLIASAAEDFVRVDRDSHSISDTLLGVAPLWTVCVLAWWWVRRLGQSSR